MHDQPLILRPALSLRELAKRCWEQITQPARDRIASNFRTGRWSAVWENGKLRIKRQQTKPAGTAFDAEHSDSIALTLGAPIIEYDCETITATGLNDTDPVGDEAIDVMVELAKLLTERCRSSGWTCVVVDGNPEMVRKLELKLRADSRAPDVVDTERARAVECSRGRRG
jgi:hypothetical protein